MRMWLVDETLMVDHLWSVPYYKNGSSFIFESGEGKIGKGAPTAVDERKGE